MDDSVTETAPAVQAEENQEIASSETKDSVQYETYRRTVGEAKKAKEKARELEAQVERFQQQEKARQEKELEDQQEYKKLIEIRNTEITNLKEELGGLKGSVTGSIKRDAFLGTLQGTVPKEYHSLIPVDQIAYDPETGQVDEMSLNAAVEEFRKIHHRLIDSGDVSKLPNQRPIGVGASVTGPAIDYNKLSAKERADLIAKDMIDQGFNAKR